MKLTIQLPSSDDLKFALCDEDNIREFKKGMSDAYKTPDHECKDIELTTGPFCFGYNQECTSYLLGYVIGVWENFDEMTQNVAKYGHKSAFRMGFEREGMKVN